MEQQEDLALKVKSRVLLDKIEVLYRLEKDTPNLSILNIPEEQLDALVDSMGLVIWTSKK